MNANKVSRLFFIKSMSNRLKGKQILASYNLTKFFTEISKSNQLGFLGRGRYIYNLAILCFRPFEVAKDMALLQD